MTEFKKVMSRSNATEKRALLRAGTPLMYAHWEGFIKGAAIAYGSYLSNSGLKYQDILESFQGLEAISEVRQLMELRKRIFASSKIVSSLRAIPGKQVRLPLNDFIGNVGNLNYDLFSEMIQFVGISPDGFETKRALIDVSLLKNRNDIAHGEYIQIDEDEFSVLLSEIFPIMENFKTAIQNAVALKGYLRAQPAVAVAPTPAPAPAI